MVLDFIKSLFMPSKMVRFRYMSVLFAIGIFVISSYILMFPAKVNIEKNFKDSVVNENALYLQAITEIPTASSKVDEVIAELHSKGLKINDLGQLTATNMGCVKIITGNGVLGSLQLNENNKWTYNGVDTNVVFSGSETNATPTLTTENGLLVINGATTDVDFSTVTGNIDTIKVSLNKKGYVEVNGNITSILSTKDTVHVDVNENKKIVINGVETSETIETDAAVAYFIPRSDVNYYENTISYQNDEGITIKIKFVIDLYDEKPNFNPEESFKYVVPEEGKVNETFPDINNTEYHLVIFRNECVYYQANPSGIADLQIERYGSNLNSVVIYSYYSSVNVDSSFFETTTKAVDSLSTIISVGYIANYNSVFSIVTFVYCVGFTLLFSFIFWLFFRKSGRLKKFKEYYNIASIVAIPITIVVFIVLWFYPDGIGNVYPLAFTLYYLFALYKINSTPEIV